MAAPGAGKEHAHLRDRPVPPLAWRRAASSQWAPLVAACATAAGEVVDGLTSVASSGKLGRIRPIEVYSRNI